MTRNRDLDMHDGEDFDFFLIDDGGGGAVVQMPRACGKCKQISCECEEKADEKKRR